MKLGKLGLYFILSAAAVLSVFAVDHDLGTYKAEIDATDNTKVKVTLGTKDLTFAATAANAAAIQKAAAARTALKEGIALTGTVPDGIDAMVFPDGRKLTFTVATNKLTITVEEDKLPFPAIATATSLEEAKIILTATPIKFGDIEVAGLAADKVKELGLHEGTTANGVDAWLKGSIAADKLTFHVARKGDKVYIVTSSTTVTVPEEGWFGRSAKLTGVIVVLLGLGIAAFHFILRFVDEDVVTAGVSGSSVIPDMAKDVMVGDISEEENWDGFEDVVRDESGRGRIIPGKTTGGEVIVQTEDIGTAEVTLAALFLLPFLL